MAAASNEDDDHDESRLASNNDHSVDQDSDGDDDDEDEDEEGEDEEPKLKYTRLTGSLGPVYRNGDATSIFMVAGDKMVWRRSQPPPIAEHMLSSR
jgi:hypothetical protein